MPGIVVHDDPRRWPGHGSLTSCSHYPGVTSRPPNLAAHRRLEHEPVEESQDLTGVDPDVGGHPAVAPGPADRGSRHRPGSGSGAPPRWWPAPRSTRSRSRGANISTTSTPGGREREVGQAGTVGPTTHSASAKARTCSAGDIGPGSTDSKPSGSSGGEQLGFVVDAAGVLLVAAAHVEPAVRRAHVVRQELASGATARSRAASAGRRRAARGPRAVARRCGYLSVA